MNSIFQKHSEDTNDPKHSQHLNVYIRDRPALAQREFQHSEPRGLQATRPCPLRLLFFHFWFFWNLKKKYFFEKLRFFKNIRKIRFASRLHRRAPSFSRIFRRFVVFSQALPQPAPSFSCIFRIFRRFVVFSQALPQRVAVIFLYFPKNSRIFLRPTATRRHHFLVFSEDLLYFPRPYRNQAPSFSRIFPRILVFSQALQQPGAVIFLYFPKNSCIFQGPTATRRSHFLVFS